MAQGISKRQDNIRGRLLKSDGEMIVGFEDLYLKLDKFSFDENTLDIIDRNIDMVFAERENRARKSQETRKARGR